jgi:hypothetical protein
MFFVIPTARAEPRAMHSLSFERRRCVATPSVQWEQPDRKQTKKDVTPPSG